MVRGGAREVKGCAREVRGVAREVGEGGGVLERRRDVLEGEGMHRQGDNIQLLPSTSMMMCRYSGHALGSLSFAGGIALKRSLVVGRRSVYISAIVALPLTHNFFHVSP